MAPLSLHFFFFFILCFSLSSASIVAAGHHQRRPKPVEPKPTHAATPANATRGILNACAATRFPATCAAALSSSTISLPAAPTALDLTAAAISTAATNLTVAQSIAKSILDSSAGNVNRTNAAINCIDFLSLSSRRLSAANAVVKTNPSSSMPDARAWASAALLYQYDCWSALKYVNTTRQVSGAMQFMADLITLTSNALSMIAAYQRYGDNTAAWAPPQTERDGYWADTKQASKNFITTTTAEEMVAAVDTTVCKDGLCKFKTVQAAVDAAPEFGEKQFLVYIKEGVYEETVRVPFEKSNLVFVGDGMGKTVITGSLNAGMPGVSTYNTATVAVLGDRFMARNLTFANTAGPDAHQAVAFRSDSDLSIIEDVEFLGHQDTLYAHGLRQFYRRCRIAGTVDFIFGNSAAVFDSCNVVILPRQLNPSKGEANTVTAHGRSDPAQATGFVFRNCVVNGSDDYYFYYRQKPAAHRSYLGRPWKEYSRTVFMNSYLAEIVRPEGWLAWDGDYALKTLFYGEFGNVGPAADTAERVTWSSRIPAEHVGVYTNQNFIQGDRWIPSNA